MVWKLLRKNISVSQILGYSIASLIGLTIVISAVKLYGDVSSTFTSEDSFIKKDYIIISKPVSTAAALGKKTNTTFSDEDIEDIKSQPWVRNVGEFTAADFSINAVMNVDGHIMSTHLFFEAIPDDFLDLSLEEWSFTPPAEPEKITAEQIENIEIPVIVSRDYLTLYNFGFAASRGMPQLNEKLINAVPIEFRLSGNGHNEESYKGRIVGFSSRLNTIAVPLDFIQWANKRYAPLAKREPSRLIIEANTAGDPAIKKYMDEHNYEIAGDKADNSRANYFLTVITTIVIAIGALITILAFFILMLSIYLLLQKNKQKLHDLMLLGYSPGQVARCYYGLVFIINIVVLALAVVFMNIGSSYWVERFSAIDMTSASPVTAILTGASISAFVTLFNCLAIRRIVRSNFYV